MRAVVHGDVQGVGFRYFVTRTARPLGLSGWVRNRDDGSVEIVAEGEKRNLEELLRAAREGPRHASVTGVDVQWSKAAGDLDPFDLVC